MNSRFALLFVALLASGCNHDPYGVAQVSGKVTLDGKPVPQLAVMFQPVAPEGNINPGPGSYGITDAEGRYSLRLVGKESPGAVIGKHKVRMDPYSEPQSAIGDAPYRPPKPLVPIPSKYNRAEAILEFDVLAKGSNSADFQLTAK